jgi:hypothetical protein
MDNEEEEQTMAKPMDTPEEFHARMAAVQQLTVTPGDVTTCEHMLGEYKAAMRYVRRHLRALDTHQQDLPSAEYRAQRTRLQQTLYHLKLAHYHLLQAQALNLRVLASPPMPDKEG